MGRIFETIDEQLAAWINKQHLFFVATAPNDPDGHVNLSPKGTMETFRVLGGQRVAYVDLMGSGIETVAHLRENSRITLMFCAFDGPPKVIRLQGLGRVVQQQDVKFPQLLEAFDLTPELTATLRSIIIVDVTRIADSCGFVVPKMEFVEQRQTLFHWAESQQQRDGDEWTLKYQQANNLRSIDGLPGLELDGEFSDDETTRFSSKGRAL